VCPLCGRGDDFPGNSLGTPDLNSPMAQQLGVTVIGLGRMGQIHANTCMNLPECRLVSVCCRTGDFCQQMAASLGSDVEAITSAKEAMEDPRITIVVIATPTSEHAEHIQMALNAGKHVFTDKPVALDSEAMEVCFNLAASMERGLFCGYQRRFDVSFQECHRLIHDDDSDDSVGQPVLIRLTSRDHPCPPIAYLAAGSTGSFFADFSTHDIDMIRWLTGEEPQSIWACAASALQVPGLDDTAVIMVSFPSGCLGIIDNSRRSIYGYDNRAEILCTNGLLQVENPPVHGVQVAGWQGLRQPAAVHSFPQRYAAAYAEELRLFVQAVGTSPSAVQALCQHWAQDCVRTTQLTDQCQLIRQDQRQVEAALIASYATQQRSQIAPFIIYRMGDGSVEPIGCCVVGTGRMGAVRARAIEACGLGRVIYCHDVVPAACDAFAAQFPHCAPAHALRVALEDPAVQAIFIATTSATHDALIKQAALAGKAIFCEKPLSLSLEGTKEAAALCAAQQVPLTCGLQRRSDPTFMDLKQQVDNSGSPLELLRITARDGATHNSASYLLNSGGYLWDSVIHDIDAARWLVGEEPCEVFALSSAFIPEIQAAGDFDNVAVTLRFPSGALCTIDNNRRAVFGYDQRIEAFGAFGQITSGNHLQTSCVKWSAAGGTYALPVSGLERYAASYAEEVRHWLQLLREGGQPRITMNDCIRAAVIVEAIQESLDTQKPVSLSSE
jgi:myo-inositol 2-dehydrogenase / D-chiro-inositol 1-dehydrogenase